jgi:hypothetical protein
LGWVDEWNKIVADNVAKTVSLSWSDAQSDSGTIIFDNMIFSEMAVQGQSVFVTGGGNNGA